MGYSVGTAGDDILDGFDEIFGLGGNDTLTGRSSDDSLYGGEGADILNGGDGTDTAGYRDSTEAVNVNLKTGETSGGEAAGDSFISIENLNGSNFNDTLIGDTGNNGIRGGAGDDILDGDAGDDILHGDAGADVLIGGTGNDTASYDGYGIIEGVNVNLKTGKGTGGYAEGDTFDGIENITGSFYDDILTGDDGNNVIDGDFYNDILEGGKGADTLIGGNGSDTAIYSNSSAAVQINTVTGINTGGDAEGDTFSGIEKVEGSAFNDTFIGGSPMTFKGGDGNDTYVISYSGITITENDNNGTDVIETSVNYKLSSYVENLKYTGTSDFIGTGNAQDNTIIGGIGNDTLDGGGGADLLIGNDGSDTASYQTSSYTVNVNLKTGEKSGKDAAGDVFIDIENLTGSTTDDVLTGDDGNNIINGYYGNDILDGGKGADTLIGGPENEYGRDTASYANSNEAVKINIDTGINTGGYAEGDTLESIDIVTGSVFDDTFASSSEITFKGGAGNDTYFVGNSDVFIEEYKNEGEDVVFTSVNYDLYTGVETLTYTGSSDFVGAGNSLNNTITGGIGNDTLIGESGADILIGGEGSDTASYAGSGPVDVNLKTGVATGNDATGDTFVNIENLTGSDGRDTLTGDTEENILNGGGSDDVLNGDDGNDTLIGGEGADTLNGGDGTDTASYIDSTAGVTVNLLKNTGSGSAAGDIFTSIENLEGSAYADTLTGNADNNTLSGGAGDDILMGGAGADILNGGTGEDKVSYESSLAAVTVDLSTGTGTGGDAEGDTYTSIERVIGSSYDDILTGSVGADMITGGAGDDIIRGGAGNDVLSGGAGADTLIGGDGYDTANYSQSTSAIGIDLRTGTGSGDAAGDTLSSIEAFSGTKYADSFIGGTTMAHYNSGAGDDHFIAGSGAERIYADVGADTVSYELSTAAVTVNLATGIGSGGYAKGDTYNSIETIIGSDHDDTFITTANTTLAGGLGNDTYDIGASAAVITENADGGIDLIKTSSDSYTLADNLENLTYTGSTDFIGSGNDANNVLTGGAQADTLYGLAGNDTLIGGHGDDMLDGGAGDDVLQGGEGSDTFVFNTGYGNDVITDYQSSSDSIDLSGMGFTTLDDAAAYASEIADGVLFDFGNGDTLTVHGLDYASLTQSDLLM